jgi:hypothetical protein
LKILTKFESQYESVVPNNDDENNEDNDNKPPFAFLEILTRINETPSTSSDPKNKPNDTKISLKSLCCCFFNRKEKKNSKSNLKNDF